MNSNVYLNAHPTSTQQRHIIVRAWSHGKRDTRALSLSGLLFKELWFLVQSCGVSLHICRRSDAGGANSGLRLRKLGPRLRPEHGGHITTLSGKSDARL